jgi:hypothetical protein
VEAATGDALIALSRRNVPWRDRLRSYRVILDGTQVAKIKRGQAIELPVAAGRHDLLLEIDWCSSPTVIVDAQPGEVIRFSCAPANSVAEARAAILYAPSAYIKLTRI